MRTILISSGVFCLGTLAVSPAAAQIVIEGQGVADRARPDYDAIGSRLGSFRLFPSVTVTAGATDNYLATDTDRRGAAYATVVPELYFRKEGGGREQVEARAFLSQTLNANLPNENAASGGASVSAAYEPMRNWQLRADASAARYVESRASLGAFQSAAEPVRFEAYHAGIGATRSFVDLNLSVNAAIDRFQYRDTRLADDVPIDQDYRDLRVGTIGGSANYALRNGVGLVVAGSYVDQNYDFGPGSPGFSPATDINRDSSGFDVSGGVTLELSSLIFGSIRAGYLNRKYQDQRLFDYGGLSFSADVLWNVTPLTSIRGRASRSLQETSSTTIASNTRSDFRLSVDHELYRYIILSGDASYGSFSPNGPGIGGNEYSVGAGARYLIDRRYSVTAGLRHARRSSDARELRYRATYATVGVRVQF